MRWYLEALSTIPGLSQASTTNTTGFTFIEQLFGARIFAHIPSHYFFPQQPGVNHYSHFIKRLKKKTCQFLYS